MIGLQGNRAAGYLRGYPAAVLVRSGSLAGTLLRIANSATLSSSPLPRHLDRPRY